MDAVQAAARAACRAWFTDQPLGLVFSNLADALAIIDGSDSDACNTATTTGQNGGAQDGL